MQNSEPQSPLVLVVDDERDIADTTAELLECHGYRVAVAYDAKSALELVDRESPDVVFADIRMPEVDGWTLCTKLRVRSDTRNALIVAVTAYSLEMQKDISAASGFDLHLVKPVNPDSLIRLIERRRTPADEYADSHAG